MSAADSCLSAADSCLSHRLVPEPPLFAYLAPGRFAAIDRSNAFPFPAEMKK